MEATFSGWFLGPYKVIKIGYGLFSYALKLAKLTSASFRGAFLKEYLVVPNCGCPLKDSTWTKLRKS